MTNNLLAQSISPPTNPLEAPTPNDWQAIERKIGSDLPEDYKEFIEKYGSGRIFGFIWVFNPFSKNENLNMEIQIKSQRLIYEAIEKNGGAIPHKFFPIENGIIPFGITENGDVLFWKTSDKTNKWTITLNGARTPEWENFEMSMGEFFHGLFMGKIKCETFPEIFNGNNLGFEKIQIP